MEKEALIMPCDGEPLLNVHQIMACVKPCEQREVTINCVFRTPPPLKKLATQICEANGKDLSTFLRGCMETLVREYGG